MKPKIRGLLVHERNDRFLILKSALDALEVETTRAYTCRMAESLLCETPPPHLVFTDVVLPDGNWLDLLDLAAKAKDLAAGAVLAAAIGSLVVGVLVFGPHILKLLQP